MNDNKERMTPGLKVALSKPMFDSQEAEAGRKVIESRWLIFGPIVEKFERDFAARMGAKYGIAVNSGSSALLVAMAALGVGPGDEIIAPNMTFISTASAALFLGAIPVFCDITLDDYAMDPALVESLITSRTKAIVPVHYAGQSCRIEELRTIARKHKIALLEDAAESHLAAHKGRFTGTWGEIGIFSFTPSKPMTTGEGGMIVTDSEELAKSCRLIRNFGDTDKFQWDVLGFNFRMPEVMGAIGQVQLGKLDAAVERRRQIGEQYLSAFQNVPGLIAPYRRSREDHNFQLFTLRLDPQEIAVSNNDIISQLIQKGVSTRLYYPSLHRQKVFARFASAKRSFPNSAEYERTAFSIPLYPALTDEEVAFVIHNTLEVIASARRTPSHA